MKKTQFIELICNIKKTWVSFFSIVMFVILGAGLFLGLSWAGTSTMIATDKAYDEQKFHNFDISFVYGITSENLAHIAEVEGVSKVEGGYTTYVTFTHNGQGHVATVLSATNEINQVRCLDGAMPTQIGEIALDSEFAKERSIEVGDVIVFNADATNDPDGMQYLNTQTFTVTALIAIPSYLMTDKEARGMTSLAAGAADCFIVATPASFDTSAYDGCYSNAYIICDELLGISTFSKDYSKKSKAIKERLTALGGVDGTARYASLRNNAQELVDEGRTQVVAGEQQIASAEAQITSGESQLADAHQMLNDYQSQHDSYVSIIDGYIQTVAAALKAAGQPGTEAEIAAQLRNILNDVVNMNITIIDAAKKYGIDETIIAPYVSQLEEGLASYLNFISLEQQLSNGWDSYYYNQQQLESKKTELEDAKVQLTQGKVALQNAEEQLASMVELDWSVSERGDNISVVGVNAYANSTNRLCYSMALVFLIVGLLVCYSAVSRIVREQIVSVGTKKALGLLNREITLSYLLYSALAVVIGVVIAVFCAVFLIENIINASSVTRFTLSAFPPYFSLTDALLMGLIELVLIGLSTWLACKSMLRRQAVDLLRGPEPPKNKIRFYERLSFWNKMPLFSQSMVNNFFNDKLRVAGTLVGIAGCTALVVMAMTMYINIERSFKEQYSSVYSYDSCISFDSTKPEAKTAIQTILDEAGAQSAHLMRTAFLLDEPSGDVAATTVEVPEDATAFLELYHLNGAHGTSPETLDAQGVWTSEAYAVHQGAKTGDMVKLVDALGKRYELPISGIFNFYLIHHELVMSKDLYKATFGKDAVSNTILVALNGTDEERLVEQLEQVDGFFSYTNDYKADKETFDSLQSLTRTVVYIYLALSAVMALVVLLNLTVMFIEEKKRDLIVLMINGYTVRDAKRYIYRDNIVLTIIGIVIGIAFGMFIGYLSLLSLELDAGIFIHSPSWIACLVGAVASAFFAFVINLIALGRIPRFKLTDINKM